MMSDTEHNSIPTSPPPGRWRRLAATVIAAIVVVAAVLAVRTAWDRQARHPVSDDAVVVADTVGIAPRVAGPITALHVEQGRRVEAGTLLFEIDPRPFDLAVAAARAAIGTLDAQIAIETARAEQLRLVAAAAEAEVEAARAAVVQRRTTVDRLEPLTDRGFSPAELLDEALTALRVAEAEVEAAVARAAATVDARSELEALVARRRELEIDLAMAELERSHCEVRAPVDGTIIRLDLAVGSFARPGIEVFQMVAADTFHIEAQFREGRLSRIRPGDAVEIRVMTDPDRVFRGRVASIGAGVRPTDELVVEGIPYVRRELDWVRIAQKFPVRIDLDDPDPTVLRMGGSATVAVVSRPDD